MANTRIYLDKETHSFVRKLHEAWSANAPVSVYTGLRDELLDHRVQVDTRIATLGAVAGIACPQRLNVDAQWNELFTLAKSINGEGRKRKQAYNEANRLRNFALVAALWSLELAIHYGWDTAGQNQMSTIRACAIRYPRFLEDFCPRLNFILLERHCQGIKNGRAKNLIEAPLQPHRDFDLIALESALPDEDVESQWLTSQDGNLVLDTDGTLLNNLRPNHYRIYLLQKDCYGVLIARDQGSVPASRQASASNLPKNVTSQIQPLQFSGPTATPGEVVTPSRMAASVDVPTPDDFATLYNCAAPPGDVDTSPGDVATPGYYATPYCFVTPSGDVATFPGDVATPGYYATSRDISTSCHIVSTPGDPHPPLDVQISLDRDGHNMAFDPSPLQISPSPDLTSRPWLCNGPTGNICSAAAGTQQSSAIAAMQDISKEPNADANNEVEWYDIADDQPTYGDPELDSDNMPALSMSSHSIPVTSNLAYASCRPNVGLLRPVPSLSAQPRERSMFTIASPPVLDKAFLSMEEILHNRYHGMLMDYVHKIATEARQAGTGIKRKLRTQWLNPSTRWASISTHMDSELPHGKAKSYDEADVLYLTSSEIISAAQKGQTFYKPVVVKEKFSDSGMHTVEGLAYLLQDATKDGTLDVWWLDKAQPEAVSIEKVVECIRGGRDQGANVVNLRNITKSHRPLFTMLPRFRLLESLMERAREPNFGRPTERTPADVASSTDFNMLSLAGAFSGAHLDSLSGTWVRNLDGLKFWMIVPEKEMDLEWGKFAKAGSDWFPNGKERLLLLEPHDVLLMPPGLRIVHAVHSPTRCVMEGGMIWDDLTVIQILQSAHRICINQAATNETIAYQLPVIIKELEGLVRERPDRFRGHRSKLDFLGAFEHAISKIKGLVCFCTLLGCEEACECRRERRRCTPGYAAHAAMACLCCMEEHGGSMSHC